MGASGRTSFRSLCLISALSLSAGLAAPSFATTKPDWTLNSTQSVVTFEDALRAYDAKNYDLALANAKIAATAGNDEAMVLAGNMLMNGEAGIINDKEAADWFRQAASFGNTDAQVLLGKMALKSRGGLMPADALAYFSQASQAGRTDARRAIGEMYQKGIGIAKDPEKAKVWLRQSADAGDISGARKMGDSLIETDPKSALQWYEKAADAGDAEAAYIAAVMYAENLDIRPNGRKAAMLMRQAAESGIAGAQADYGLLVYQGAGVERDIDAAADWFKRSANGGDSEGQFLYAFTLAKGEGVPQNFEDAYFWLLKSGESGVDDYDTDRKVLRKRLEDNVDQAVLMRARNRAGL
ncbi:tetratricopeptide repeat protein [Fretibacter rubidus]|uniref:tetratricopeptide repeat protein n=1 Tax=Fretibacter rubidus TaxID=570162 RepID=UPI00352BC7F0